MLSRLRVSIYLRALAPGPVQSGIKPCVRPLLMRNSTGPMYEPLGEKTHRHASLLHGQCQAPLVQLNLVLRQSDTMIKIGPYLIDTDDDALAIEVAQELNRRAEKKALPHRGYVAVSDRRVQYELAEPPVQSRTV